MVEIQVIEELFREAIEEIVLPCPDCGYTYYGEDCPTTCTTCWQEGGEGRIKVSGFFDLEFKKKD